MRLCSGQVGLAQEEWTHEDREEAPTKKVSAIHSRNVVSVRSTTGVTPHGGGLMRDHATMTGTISPAR